MKMIQQNLERQRKIERGEVFDEDELELNEIKAQIEEATAVE